MGADFENCFTSSGENGLQRKKTVFEVLAEGSRKTKRSVVRLETCCRLLGS